MKLFFFAFKVKAKFTGIAFHAEFYPFLKYRSDAHLARYRADKHVEVAFERIFERCRSEQFCHELIGVGALSYIYRKTEARETYLISEIGDLLKLSFLYQVGYPFYDLLN